MTAENITQLSPEQRQPVAGIMDAFQSIPTVADVFAQIETGAFDNIYDAQTVANTMIRTLENGSPTYITDTLRKDMEERFRSKETADTPEGHSFYLEPLLDEVRSALSRGTLKLDSAIEMPVKNEGVFMEVTADLYDQLMQGISEDKAPLLREKLNRFAGQFAYDVYVTKGRDSSYMSGGRMGQEVVLSEDTAKSFGKTFERTFKLEGYSKKRVEKMLGYSLDELGARYVYAHELGHVLDQKLNNLGTAYATSWEQQFLYEHPDQSLTAGLHDSTAASVESWAEGIAQLYLQGVLVKAGLDDIRLFDAIKSDLIAGTITGAQKAFDALHSNSAAYDLGTSMDDDGYRRRNAAKLGYGTPMDWPEINARLEFVVSEDYSSHEKAQERTDKILALIQGNRWYEHIKDRGFDADFVKNHKRAVEARQDIKAQRIQKKEDNRDFRRNLAIMSVGAAAAWGGIHLAGVIDEFNGGQQVSVIESEAEHDYVSNISIEKGTKGLQNVNVLLNGTFSDDKDLAVYVDKFVEEDTGVVVVVEPITQGTLRLAVSQNQVLGKVSGSETGETLDITEDMSKQEALDAAIEEYMRAYPEARDVDQLRSEIFAAIKVSHVELAENNRLTTVYTLDISR